MMFSFKQHPIQKLVQDIEGIFPSIQKAVGIYYDRTEGTIRTSLYLKGDFSDQKLTHGLDAVKKLRDEKIRFVWTNPTSLPFETNKLSNIRQMELADEEKNTVLVLRFESIADKKSDLLFLYFNTNTSNFEICDDDKPITTTNKHMVGQTTSQLIGYLISKNYDDQKILQNVSSLHSGTQSLLNEKEDFIKRTEQKQFNQLLQACQMVIKSYADKHKVKIVLDIGFVDRLKEMKEIGVFELQNIVRETIETLINLNTGESIRITPEFLIRDTENTPRIEVQAVRTPTPRSVEDSTRYQRTIELLDRYEESAARLAAQNIPLTSVNLGNYCLPKAISAAAISDALKKHGKKIGTLLEKHPENWPIIRNEFRPIQNILIKISDSGLSRKRA